MTLCLLFDKKLDKNMPMEQSPQKGYSGGLCIQGLSSSKDLCRQRLSDFQLKVNLEQLVLMAFPHMTSRNIFSSTEVFSY